MNVSTRVRLAAVVFILASLPLVACGGGSGTGGATAVDLKAVDINWEPKTLNAKVNQPLTVNIANGGTLEHSFAVPDLGVPEKTIAPGASDTVTFIPSQAGTFQYVCNIPGHKEAGMVGTLTVSQ
jgi:plastocyanin